MPRFRHVASILTVGVGVASLSVLSAAAGAGAASNSSTSNSENNNDNTTQTNNASTSGSCSPIQQSNARDINNSNDVRGGDAGNGGKGGNASNPRRALLEGLGTAGGGNNQINIPILSPGTGNGNGDGGNGGTGGNGGPASGHANAGNQVQSVSNCGNTTVNPTQVVTRTVTVQAPAATANAATVHFTG